MPAHRPFELLRLLLCEQIEISERCLERRSPEFARDISAAQRLRVWIARANLPCAEPWDVKNSLRFRGADGRVEIPRVKPWSSRGRD
jgi:hypothetical protein